MTEREKMLAGLLYNCGDGELLARWHQAKDLTRAYAQLPSQDLEGKRRILEELLGGFGKGLWITPPFYVDYGENIYFGDNCEVNGNCTFQDDNVIRIGRNALIGPNVQIYTAFHPTQAAQRFGPPLPDGSFAFCRTQSAPVTVGDNVWIGGGRHPATRGHHWGRRGHRSGKRGHPGYSKPYRGLRQPLPPRPGQSLSFPEIHKK